MAEREGGGLYGGKGSLKGGQGRSFLYQYARDDSEYPSRGYPLRGDPDFMSFGGASAVDVFAGAITSEAFIIRFLFEGGHFSTFLSTKKSMRPPTIWARTCFQKSASNFISFSFCVVFDTNIGRRSCLDSPSDFLVIF